MGPGSDLADEADRLHGVLAVEQAELAAKIFHLHLLHFVVDDLVQVTCLLAVEKSVVLVRQNLLQLLIEDCLEVLLLLLFCLLVGIKLELRLLLNLL